MGTIYKLLGIVALLAGAWLLHSFYVSYEVNSEASVLSWTSTRGVHARYLDHLAKLNVRPEREQRRYNPHYGAGFPSYRDNPANGCRLLREPLPGTPKWAVEGFKEHPRNYRCERPWPVPPFDEFVFPAVTYDDALATARVAHPTSRTGMVPSRASAGDSPGPEHRTSTLWLGVIAPAAMIFAALALLISIFGSWRRGRAQSRPALPAAPIIATYAPKRAVALPDRLKAAFGNDLPVSVGDASRDSPLVITEKVDYVSIEYAVAKFLMTGQEWKKERQNLLRMDGRFVDELVFSVRENGDGQWEECSFFFDITAGYKQAKA
ncbi:hypothetical protein [uncultured Luteimonas sp.]|uniref:hypothetical protein n=1 Tax=uncultured Luteimonas sp. TaxID=453144 RepID=UPI0026240ECF|nr:hypothetical protein [uncultured Luteimonas sp.]